MAKQRKRRWWRRGEREERAVTVQEERAVTVREERAVTVREERAVTVGLLMGLAEVPSMRLGLPMALHRTCFSGTGFFPMFPAPATRAHRSGEACGLPRLRTVPPPRTFFPKMEFCPTHSRPYSTVSLVPLIATSGMKRDEADQRYRASASPPHLLPPPLPPQPPSRTTSHSPASLAFPSAAPGWLSHLPQSVTTFQIKATYTLLLSPTPPPITHSFSLSLTHLTGNSLWLLLGCPTATGLSFQSPIRLVEGSPSPARFPLLESPSSALSLSHFSLTHPSLTRSSFSHLSLSRFSLSHSSLPSLPAPTVLSLFAGRPYLRKAKSAALIAIALVALFEALFSTTVLPSASSQHSPSSSRQQQ
ncbi:unnamed protein product [Closterium sp. Naga37s-1]|nr:unnamed protein product [Closterium sp. Naga37s-1]